MRMRMRMVTYFCHSHCHSCLLARPEYHVNIYFNLREQAVLLAIVAFCAAFQSSTFKKPMEMQTLTNICTADSNGRKGVTAWMSELVSEWAKQMEAREGNGWKRFFVYISIIDTKRTLRTFPSCGHINFRWKQHTLLDLIKQFTWRFMHSLIMWICAYVLMCSSVCVWVRQWLYVRGSLSLSLIIIQHNVLNDSFQLFSFDYCKGVVKLWAPLTTKYKYDGNDGREPKTRGEEQQKKLWHIQVERVQLVSVVEAWSFSLLT